MRRLKVTPIAVVFASASLGLALSIPGVTSVLLELSGPPVVASSGALSEHDMEELNAMSPQDQVTRLLEKAINHYEGAGEEIARRLDSWTGQIHSTPELSRLTDTAYFSSDLRVRAAALEIWLVRDNVPKTSDTVHDLIREAAATEERRYFRLSMLGILGNRGIEPERVLETLTLYARDPSGPARAAAINGLGLLGTEGTVPVLLEIMRNDPSYDLRERAACNLADSGMLSRDLRQNAVPELIRFLQDQSLDKTTRKWVLQALREITQQNLPDDPVAWLTWYAHRPNR
ncbi:MAG: HEAT repeat domain-containing protein [Bryobacteraceae bacterium]